MQFDSNLKAILDQISHLQIEIDRLRPISPDLEQKIMQKFRLDWNFHSNHIEGNQLTYGETKTFILHGLTAKGKPFKDHLAIRGHNEAILWLEEIVQQHRPLNETFICQLHQIILVEPYQVDAITPEGLPTKRWISLGSYKQTPNHVKTKTGEMFYFASPEETPAKMGDLLTWYRQMNDNEEIPALLTAALLHYKFIRIHPFDDGNGRMARILMNLVLMMNGFPPVIIKSEKKEAYYQALQMADGGDELAFVAYIGEQLIHSQELYLKGARGEEIEEMNDIDKEIALLKKSLEGEKEKITLNRTIQVDSYGKVIRPLFSETFDKLKQFDELFFKTEIMMYENNSGGLVTSIIDFINKTDYSFRDKQDVPLRIGFEYKWIDFKKTENVNFDCIISLHFTFHQYNSFTISSNQSSFSSISINYKSIYLSEDDNKKIANALAKDVLEQIKKQLKNEDESN